MPVPALCGRARQKNNLPLYYLNEIVPHLQFFSTVNKYGMRLPQFPMAAPFSKYHFCYFRYALIINHKIKQSVYIFFFIGQDLQFRDLTI